MDTNLDSMIDAALSRYSEAVPLEGLEQRVLNRIRLAEMRRRRPRWLGFALAFATVLLLVAIGFRTRPVPRARVLNVATAPSRSRLGSGDARINGTATVRERPTVHRAQRSFPKERIFPRLAPLSSEERSLLAYVRLQPVEIQGIPANQPIEIEPIQIQPLQ